MLDIILLRIWKSFRLKGCDSRDILLAQHVNEPSVCEPEISWCVKWDASFHVVYLSFCYRRLTGFSSFIDYMENDMQCLRC